MTRILTPFVLGSDLVRRQRAFTKEDLIKTKLVFRILFLVAFMALLSLFYIWSRVQIVNYGYEINALRAKRLQLSEENRRLSVEVSMLKSPTRIENFARDKLKMQTPKSAQVRRIR